MGTVFKKTFTKVVPAGAELFIRKDEQFARWKTAKSRTRTAKVTTGKDGSPRLLIEAKTFTAKFRDGQGIVREVATGCHDETSARNVLAELVKRGEHVKSGLVTAAQDATIDHQRNAIDQHIDAYLTHLEATGACRVHRGNVAAAVRRVVAECQFTHLLGLDRSAVEAWMNRQEANRMSARTRNAHRAAVLAFCNWCVREKRLATNPLSGLPKANEKADPRRHRRALAEAEIVALLDVARRRPLLDAQTVRRGERKGQAVAKLLPETVARLETLGRERALIYKTLVLTGLRKGELASLTVGQLTLTGPTPSALLHAADEKNRQGSRIPLRADLAADLKGWLADKLVVTQDTARKAGEAIPARLPDDTPVFVIPAALVQILDRDLVMAGIARKVKDAETGKERIDKRDNRGWTVDVHALRTTFGTLLSKGGVAPRTAQAAMRHSSIDLTMNVYTDPRLLDVAGAMDALPSLSLDTPQGHRQRLTGTYAAGPLAPTLAPTPDDSSKSQSTAGKTRGGGEWSGSRENDRKRPDNQGFRQPQSTPVSKRATGLEPATVSLEGWCLKGLSLERANALLGWRSVHGPTLRRSGNVVKREFC